MRIEKYPIQSFNGSPIEFKKFVSDLIDRQIEKKKLDFMIQWEKNHHHKDDVNEHLISELDYHKNRILNSLEELDPEATVQCNISIHFCVKNKWEDN